MTELTNRQLLYRIGDIGIGMSLPQINQEKTPHMHATVRLPNIYIGKNITDFLYVKLSFYRQPLIEQCGANYFANPYISIKPSTEKLKRYMYTNHPDDPDKGRDLAHHVMQNTHWVCLGGTYGFSTYKRAWSHQFSQAEGRDLVKRIYREMTDKIVQQSSGNVVIMSDSSENRENLGGIFQMCKNDDAWTELFTEHNHNSENDITFWKTTQDEIRSRLDRPQTPIIINNPNVLAAFEGCIDNVR